MQRMLKKQRPKDLRRMDLEEKVQRAKEGRARRRLLHHASFFFRMEDARKERVAAGPMSPTRSVDAGFVDQSHT